MSNKPLPPFIRASKLAKKSGISRRTIYALIQSGAIEGKCLSHPSGRKAWFVTAAAYLAYTAKPA